MLIHNSNKYDFQKFSSNLSATKLFTTESQVKSNYEKFSSAPFSSDNTDIPSEYTCQQLLTTKIIYNLRGWEYDSSCLVDVGSLFFMKSDQCISLMFQSDIAPEIKVHSNLVKYKLRDKFEIGDRKVQVFCTDLVLIDLGVRQYFVTWVPVAKLFDPIPSIKLLNIRTGALYPNEIN